MPDRASGDLRFFSILSILAKENQLTLALTASKDQLKELGKEEYDDYVEQITNLNISISTLVTHEISHNHFDGVFFEFYHSCQHLLDLIRFYQAKAIIIVDSVDVHFKRFEAKAKLTQLKEDFIEAESVKNNELAAYRDADIVIVVTKEDQTTIQSLCPNTRTIVIPNIHQIPPFTVKKITLPIKLLFVGGFKHAPNVDAMLFFCTEVMPLLRQHQPGIELSIVGSSPTEQILSLRAPDIKVTGFVPSVTPYYKEANIIIAPLRYGGGMKGKVGEAFSFSTPVITTDFGAEGFGIRPDIHFLLADSAKQYLQAIQKLINDHFFYHKIAQNAWQFIHDNYSNKKVEVIINDTFQSIKTTKTKKLTISKYIRIFTSNFVNQHILWRFK